MINRDSSRRRRSTSTRTSTSARRSGLVGAWVATADRRLLGHVALTADGADGAEAGRLFVIPDAQGSGVGVALLEVATRRAETIGRRVELRVVEDSSAAIRLYERLGWTLLGREPAPFTWADGTRPTERRYAAPDPADRFSRRRRRRRGRGRSPGRARRAGRP